MDNRYYSTVITEMEPFFEENGFKADGETFKSETLALKIEYDETKQIYKLMLAEIAEGKIGEFEVASTYLFDDSQTQRDAESVGIDFVDTLKKKLGIKAKRRAAGLEIDLPTASKGSAVNVTALTSKLLAVYPALKDTYKAEVEAKGKYLYLDFMTTYCVPEIRATLEAGSKKTTKKLIDMMIEMFVQGDNATSTAVVAILAAAIGKNEERFIAATEHMDECTNLVTSINNIIPLLGTNKKFTKALKYED